MPSHEYPQIHVHPPLCVTQNVAQLEHSLIWHVADSTCAFDIKVFKPPLDLIKIFYVLIEIILMLPAILQYYGDHCA